MTDYVEKFLTAGIVFCAWAAIGVLVGQIYPPAIILALPIIVWFSIGVLAVGVAFPIIEFVDWIDRRAFP